MTIKVFKITDFDVTMIPYMDSALMIFHNSIKGVGTILKTQRDQLNQVEIKRLIGQETPFTSLLAHHIALLTNVDNLTLVFSFKPEILSDMNYIRRLLEELKQAFAS